MKLLSFAALASVLCGCACPCTRPARPPGPGADALRDFQKRAAQFHAVVRVPAFETSSNEIQATFTKTLAAGNAALDRIGRVSPGKVTFENTVRALDDRDFQLALVANRLAVIEQTSTNPAVRDAATDSIKQLSAWMVGLDYREDVYAAVKAYADTQPKLAGEDAELLSETMRDYRRAGPALPKADRDEVERMRKELTGLETDFENNVTKARQELKLTRAELDGVPEDFLRQTKTGDDEYTVKVNITWHYMTVMENARSEDTRRKMETGRDNLARHKPSPGGQRLSLPDDIARDWGIGTL